MTTRITRRTVLAGLSTLAAAPSRAQAAWPDRTITLTHGFGAGGNADVVGRIVADRLSSRLGQQIVIDPKPGAGGTTAAGLVARAAPDGYTLSIIPGGHAVAAAIYKKLPYNPVDDFSWISMLTDFPFVFATYPDHSVKNIAELIKTALGQDARLTCGTPGNGTGQHLSAELFAAMAKIKLQHLPYRASTQATTDLMGKRIDFQMDTPTALLELVKSGKLRAIGTTGTSRFFALPNVPTIAEAGVSGYSVTSWLGLAAPPGVPTNIVKRVNTEVAAVLAEPATIEKLKVLGSETKFTSPDDFKGRVLSDIAKWTQVVGDANIERI
jgi:tripartite-type tricarboxylate transporter receptor subunit TctC